MMMKSIGETMSISIVLLNDPSLTKLLEGEDIVESFVKANVRTMAKEMMEQTKNSILAQAAQAVLAQANQAPLRSIATLTLIKYQIEDPSSRIFFSLNFLYKHLFLFVV